MPSSTFPDPSLAVATSFWTPASSEDRDAVLRQLDRMLAHASFRNSKRYSSLFRYLVERTLRGDRNLKERLLGIEVFGRAPDYDTNEDPVVRVTAGEIRRRIAQYYHEPGHEDEIRIDLPPGSYNPLLRLPARTAAAREAELISSAAVFGRPVEVIEEPNEPRVLPEEQVSAAALPADVNAANKFSGTLTTAILAALCVAAVTLLWIGFTGKNALDEFWAPVLAEKLPVLICIPDLDSTFSENSSNSTQTPPAEPAANAAKAPITPVAQAMALLGRDYRREKVAFADSVALANLTELLGSKGADFRIKRSEDANLEDLKGGPVVLVAGGNNHWTVQLGKQLRFTFERNGEFRYIGDADNPASRQWMVTGPDIAPGQAIDYAIISRVFDATTGGVLVTAAGLHHNGTQAAGICLASEECLQQAQRIVSGDWSKKNIQLVVETTVLGGEPGQPRVVAAYLW